MQRSDLCVVLCVGLAAACDGGRPVPDGSPGKGDAKVTDGPVVVSDGPISPDCPTYLPKSDAACSKDALTCSYGNPACPAKATCAQGKWQLSIAKCPGSAGSCPATYADAAGKGCTTKDETCGFSGLSCRCTNCTDYPVVQCSGPLTWRCEAPNIEPDCPHARPDVGAACPKAGVFCQYGCQPDVSRKCEAGKWAKASSPGGCPVSTRLAKQDIRYLTDEDRARVAAQALSLRLATYRYREAGRDRRSHLGFIIEDSPSGGAADTEKMQVDLYSYTSMLLALAQQQQRELLSLRRDLHSLRGALARHRTSRPPTK